MLRLPGPVAASLLLAALGAGPAAAQAPVPLGPPAPPPPTPIIVNPPSPLLNPPAPGTPAAATAAKASPSAATAKAPGGAKAVKTSPGKRGVRRPRWPTVVLFHINRRETMNLRLADDQGRPVRGVQRRVERFLRCHKTNKQHAMNPRLTRLIYETGRHYPGARVEIISGYRHPSVARNPRSPHMKGLACDLRVVGVKNTELRDFLRRTFKHVGVGYYPNSAFVHLDVRKGVSAFWIDYSGPGDNAMYAENPEDDLKTGRAETFKPAKIDPSWADQEGEAAVPAAPANPAPASPAAPAPGAGLAAGASAAQPPAAVP
jgi:uncharacterized protein YcbK (DUF882 family)